MERQSPTTVPSRNIISDVLQPLAAFGMPNPSRRPATLDDLPKELLLNLATTHLDPIDPPALHALVSLIDMGLVDANDVEALHARLYGRPFPWEWLVSWPEHFIATFIHRRDRSTPFANWLERLFIEACRRGDNDIMEVLIRRGVRPSSDHLIDAASTGMNNVVDLLVTCGLDPAATSEVSSWTPLYAACLYGQESTVRHLITTYNVDYRAITATGEYVVLQLAARWPACLEFLDQLLNVAGHYSDQ